MKKIALIIGVCVAFVACEKDPPQSSDNPPMVDESTDVLVLNEGNFMWGNASITAIHTTSETAFQEVYKSVNNVPLGDVAQSAIRYNDLLYVVLNNSSKIEVLNATSFQSEATITGFTSPRYMCIVNENPITAWVSDLYSNEISEIELATGSKLRAIALQGWTEKMVDLGSEVLVQNVTDSALYIVDKSSGQASLLNGLNNEKVIDLMANEESVTILTNLGIWQMSITGKVLNKEYGFTESRSVSAIAINWQENIAYFKNTDIFKVDLNANSEVLFFEANGKSLYGLAYNGSTNQVFITNAKDYVQKGEVIVVNPNGSIAYSVEAGIIPQFLLMPQ